MLNAQLKNLNSENPLLAPMGGLPAPQGNPPIGVFMGFFQVLLLLKQRLHFFKH
jgi:hypothetical protein